MKLTTTLLSITVVTGLVGLTSPAAGVAPDRAGKARGIVNTQRPTLEMVFVLDTTGSMGGLLEGAKQRIWGIVNEVMSSPTRPDVRIGLVAYRDNGDAYVTRVLPITRDLDRVYTTLMEFKAEGGGDGPEDVRQALADGVRKSGWSPRSPRVAQILFLVGDAPPHDDYKQKPSCISTTATAVSKGLIVNTIQCGGQMDTQRVWQEIAQRGEGRYFAIAQNGGVAAVATPYDKKLADLGAEIGSTQIAYGTAPARALAMTRQTTTEVRVS
ncbi:MAG: vWA domain-containing protein, partial [Armatimonadota bacterium]